jgi:Ca2+-binding RTX toxin-like protein
MSVTETPDTRSALLNYPGYLFVDPDVRDSAELLAGIAPSITVVHLAKDGDPLGQMAAALAGERGLSSLHILSHGEPGALLLAGIQVDTALLAQSEGRLRAIREALADDADLVLYGCSIAAGDQGRDFITALETGFGTDVTASAIPVGANLGWDAFPANLTAFSPESAARYPHTLHQTTFGIVDTIQTTTTLVVDSGYETSGLTISIERSDGTALTGVSSGFLDPASRDGSNNIVLVPNSVTYTVSYSSSISVTTFQIAEFENLTGTGNYVFTPNSGTAVTIADNAGSLAGSVATLTPTDWTNVTSFTVSYTGASAWRVGLDNIKYTVVAPATPTAGDDTLSGTAGADTVDLLAGNDSYSGLAGADTITGGTGHDTILGGDGADVIRGDDGNDQISGDADADLISGDAGNDTISGGAGADTLSGGTGNDVLSGGDDADLLYGGDGNDALSGGAGTDVIYGNAGADTLIGGASDDTLYGGAGADIMSGGASTDLLVGGAGNDTYTGSAGELNGDTISGLEAGDKIVITGTDLSSLNGSTVGSTINLGSGTLNLAGTSGSVKYEAVFSGGNTTLTIANVSTTTTSSGGSSSGSGLTVTNQTTADTAGTATGRTLVNNTGSSATGELVSNTGNGNVVTATLPTGISLTNSGTSAAQPDSTAGTTLTNEIVNTEQATTDHGFLNGHGSTFIAKSTGITLDIRSISFSSSGTAPETVQITGQSSSGSEAFVIDTSGLPTGSTIQLDNIEFAAIVGNATVNGGAGQNYVVGDSGSQFISLGDEDDTLAGGAGNDSIGSGWGEDIAYGNQGSDYVFGGGGMDTLYGGQGGDTVFGGNDNDWVYGNKGNDTLSGGENDDILFGGQNEDILYGNTGNDTLNGNLDNDTLYGGRGNDLLYGGSGNDLLAGNKGDDTLVGGEGADSFVFEFGGGNETVADFQAGIDSLSFSSGLLVTSGTETAGTTTLALSDGGTVTLTGVSKTTLMEATGWVL